MMTRYNFGAARDPEMVHQIDNAESVAPFIEIPRCASLPKEQPLDTHRIAMPIKEIYKKMIYINLGQPFLEDSI